MKNRYRLTCFAAACALLAGCAGTNPFAKAPEPELSAARKETNAGIALYNAGDYAGAIKQLGTASAIWKGEKPVQLEALKYMAFSYCLTSRPVPCKQRFEQALKLDPAFDLAPGEKGHPLWDPVFDKAKKEHR
ncbi:MAG: TssQ family T6SS-associated lipoprotein [Pseudomonadota bacterium]